LKVSDGLSVGIQAPPIAVVASYGCCSCCSYYTRIEKEEEVTTTQEQ